MYTIIKFILYVFLGVAAVQLIQNSVFVDNFLLKVSMIAAGVLILQGMNRAILGSKE